MQKSAKFILAVSAAVLTLCPAAARSVYDLPQITANVLSLRRGFRAAISRADWTEATEICAKGVELLPDDPVWRYNLACAYSRQGRKTPAFDSLKKAVELGYRAADQIKNDPDLESLRGDPRFDAILAAAANPGQEAAQAQKHLRPAQGIMGSTLVLKEENLDWHFDSMCFMAALSLSLPKSLVATGQVKSADPAGVRRWCAQKYAGPAKDKISKWLVEGTASGNAGDLYFNRDRDPAPNGAPHSMLAFSKFPLSVSLRMEEKAHARGFDRNIPNMMLPGPVFGNASLAMTHGPLRRSLPRMVLTNPAEAQRMQSLYLSNQFWVFPAHKDYSSQLGDDRFSSVSPAFLVSEGSSWSDLPFLEAAMAASAAMKPDVKSYILKHRLMGPVMQRLIRRSLVASEDEYLTPAAHPTAFSRSALNAAKVVDLAHSMTVADVSPVPLFSLMIAKNDRSAGLKIPGADYPDILPEYVPAAPLTVSAGIVLRGCDAIRKFDFCAVPSVDFAEKLEFKWVLVHGRTEAVKIEVSSNGYTALIGNEAGGAGRMRNSSLARITIDHRELLSGERVDVACFIRRPGGAWSAPSFISFSSVAQEQRSWRPDGKIAEIDYTNPCNFYSDPLIALPRKWIDVFDYDSNGNMTGWRRKVNGEVVAEFNEKGERVINRLKRVFVKVRYIPRVSGDLQELTWADAGGVK